MRDQKILKKKSHSQTQSLLLAKAHKDSLTGLEARTGSSLIKTNPQRQAGRDREKHEAF